MLGWLYCGGTISHRSWLLKGAVTASWQNETTEILKNKAKDKL
jgi:hypothetical protein